MNTPEAVIDPDQRIIDPHHHLWDRAGLVRGRGYAAFADHGFSQMVRRHPRYLLEELLADIAGGHNVRATVFIECGSMYRHDAPKAFRCVGETEFANGVAARSASGQYGDARVGAGIVGRVDLRGDSVEEVLLAHVKAGGGRFRGIRQSASYDADPRVLGPLSGRVPTGLGLYRDPAFRAGFAVLQRLGLSFDAWLLEPQLPDLEDLAKRFPGTTIVLDHVGTPLGIGAYQDKRAERFAVWRDHIRAVAELDNVVVKLGGLAMPFVGFEWSYEHRPASSQMLADAWAPYIETCIEAFGPDRCMFESNFPVDSFTCDYVTLWNALKRVVAGYAEDEKDALFFGTAARVYKLDVSDLRDA